ncbi:TRC40/GET3/ArsA family transport-energizing ATPase, partial [Aeromonas veronii]
MYHFLTNPPPFLFFTGKGGVGKTSLACASAVALCDIGKRVLLVSTDPASNVGQVFATEIGNRVTTIAAVPGLSALEIDPPAAAKAYRERIVGPVRGKLPESVVRSIEEQLSGACTTEIAAFDEFTALLTDQTLLAEYDHIVFDTAPTGHTIRLLQLPGAWSEFLEQGKGDASCLGPLAGLEKQRSQYGEAVAALADAARTRLVLVARAQQSTLREVARTHEELAAIGLLNQQLVINGLFPEGAITGDPLAMALWQREQQALAQMPQGIKGLAQDHIPLLATNLVGVESLRQLLQPQDAGEQAPLATSAHLPAQPELSSLVDELAADGHGLIMLMGKG